MFGNLARLAVAALGGALALRWGHGLTPIFIAQGVALVIYALINVTAVAGGAWFGPRRLAAFHHARDIAGERGSRITADDGKRTHL